MRERPASISVIYGPDGQPACEPLIDAEGIVYADIDLEREIELKQFHDIVGHYNRFDVFSLRLNRRQIRPLSSSEDAPFGESLPAEPAEAATPHTNAQPIT